MRKSKSHIIIVMLGLLSIGLSARAKTTYIPTYDNKIVIVENGIVDSLQNYLNYLEYTTNDSLVTYTILQQVVTPELVKSIKQMKRAAGWASVAAGFSSFSYGLSQGQLYSGRITGPNIQNYIESRQTMQSSIALAESAGEAAENLTELMIDLIISNNSDKEIVACDMQRGLTWFVQPHGETIISIQKDEELCLRTSSINPLDQDVRYIYASPTNKLKKYEISLETDNYWYLPNINSNRRAFHCKERKTGGILKVSKETMSVEEIISDDDFKAIKKEQNK